MSNSANDFGSASRQAATGREQRLDWLARADREVTGGINALRGALGKLTGWLPAPEPVPVPVPVGPARGIPARRGGRLAVTEYGGDSQADLDRRIQERINAMRASLSKRPDWQSSQGWGQAHGDSVPARRRCGT